VAAGLSARDAARQWLIGRMPQSREAPIELTSTLSPRRNGLLPQAPDDILGDDVAAGEGIVQDALKHRSRPQTFNSYYPNGVSPEAVIAPEREGNVVASPLRGN